MTSCHCSASSVFSAHCSVCPNNLPNKGGWTMHILNPATQQTMYALLNYNRLMFFSALHRTPTSKGRMS